MLTHTLLLTLGLAASFANSSKPAQQAPVFACKMNVLTDEERATLPGVLDGLIKAAPAVNELPNGYELIYQHSAKLFPQAVKWISCESRCCPFFEFHIALANNDGPMSIKITGPEGVKAFIADDLPKLHDLMTKHTR